MSPNDSDHDDVEGWCKTTMNYAKSVLSPEGKDQAGKKREQSAHRREVPRSSTMSPNDLDHDDAEGWCKTVMNYTKSRGFSERNIGEGSWYDLGLVIYEVNRPHQRPPPTGYGWTHGVWMDPRTVLVTRGLGSTSPQLGP
uniref:Uncharacterized protein n=1 Tax=Solanum tuberosum TaxID=4113 RepID=M1DXF1_SOLTU